MSFELDRCGWCVHYRGLIDGWIPSCVAYPNGMLNELYDVPGRDCGNGVRFEVIPEKKDIYDEFWGDGFSKGPFDVEKCYQDFIDSGIPKEIVIQGNHYFRIIGKLKRYYDSGEKLVLLLQLDTFHVPEISQLTDLIDEVGNRIYIPGGREYSPRYGLKKVYWKGFACLVQPTNIQHENQIGNYVRVLRNNELL